MKFVLNSTILALLLAGSVCQALTVSATDEHSGAVLWPEVCGRVRNLVYLKEQDQVTKSVITIVQRNREAVQIEDEELSVVLASDIIEEVGESSQVLEQPTFRAPFGRLLRQALVLICVRSVHVQEKTNENGVLIKAGYLDEDSTAVHSVRL
ncbi:MAG: hypothetical protein HRT45_00085 [Bdellovibrionales bacterium]|nr:hypothetical protein [Bdellovibrionales bacterium]